MEALILAALAIAWLWYPLSLAREASQSGERALVLALFWAGILILFVIIYVHVERG